VRSGIGGRDILLVHMGTHHTAGDDYLRVMGANHKLTDLQIRSWMRGHFFLDGIG
jgi:hypothetical protein